MEKDLLLISKLFKKYNLVGDLHDWAHKNKHIIFGIPYAYGYTFDEWLELIEDDVKQRTVVLSARISYDVIKFYLQTRVNDLLSTIKENELKVVSVKSVSDEEFLGLSFDLVMSLDGKLIPFEIKFSQQDNCFTGATHSTKKVKNYMLFHLRAKRNVKLNSNKTFFDTIFVMIAQFEMDKWVGKPKKDSSFTTLRLPAKIDFSNQIISGELKKNKVWCKMIPEKIEFK